MRAERAEGHSWTRTQAASHFRIFSDAGVSTESACGTKVRVVSDTHIIGTTASPL